MYKIHELCPDNKYFYPRKHRILGLDSHSVENSLGQCCLCLAKTFFRYPIFIERSAYVKKGKGVAKGILSHIKSDRRYTDKQSRQDAMK